MKKILRALENKDIGKVQALVVHQAVNPNTLIPGKGVSLLHLIIGHPSESFAFRITKLFLRFGGDPNVQSSDGVTPLHVAAAWGRTRILHLLLVNGGDPWLQDDEKKNAFNYAFEEREWNTIEILHHFHKMHSAINWKKDVELSPKFELNLEKVFVRKEKDKFANFPIEKSTKSITTQTQCDSRDTPSSPVQDKIKYFESPENSDNAVNNNKKDGEKINMGWTKDFYQTSCEVVVHCDSQITKDKEEIPETFVSSIHIDTTPCSLDCTLERPKKIKPPVDVRSQLLVELQEAVRRRSKLKMLQSGDKNTSEDPLLENSMFTANESIEKDSFITKEVSYLYGVNLEDNKILKSMSDFATKVMEEIELVEENPRSDTTIDLGSPELTNAYVSCDEDSRNVQSFIVTSSDESNLYLTPYNSNLSSNVVAGKSKEENSNENFVDMSEECRFNDEKNVEDGGVVMEEKFSLASRVSLISEDEIDFIEDSSNGKDENSTASSIPNSISYNSDVLRCELTGLGCNPGPVTKTTKKIYLKKLRRLKKEAKKRETEKANTTPVFSPVLKATLKEVGFEKIPSYQSLEEEMSRSFDNWTKRKWREGANKTSFNYLLLDPKVSLNLPKRASKMAILETWKTFLAAVFYVGKGKRSRPFAHLYQATAFWEKRSSVSPDEKTEKITEIWKEGLGVICLHVFQNIIPVEAFTREAAMIDAIGLPNLKNARKGEYYGVASTWSTREKINLGIYLLYKTMLIFLNEGERQIKPYDLD